MKTAFYRRAHMEFELAEIRGNVSVFTGALSEEHQFGIDVEDF